MIRGQARSFRRRPGYDLRRLIPSFRRFVAWLKEIERRGDAWAATKLSPGEFADAVVLDRQFKRDWPRWLAIFALAVAGGVVGYAVGNLHAGRDLAEINPEKATKALALAMLAGGAIAGVLVGISRMRLREATQRAARLQAEADRERLARAGAQADLKLLQAQVEPHFLFNTLANVRYLVQTQSPDALAMLDHLIHYLRTSLPEIRSEASTLGREAELARAYLEIMRLRMGGTLEIAIDVPPELAHAPFPPLMVMTLVENAIKHGVLPQARGQVAIHASAAAGRLRVVVEDDGRGLAGAVGRGLGLTNVRERLAALYGQDARLDLETRPGGGTRASIEVPDR